MANQRTSFAKRQREQNRKEKARAKQERLAVRRAERDTRASGTSEAHVDVTVDDAPSSAAVALATTTGDTPSA